MVEIGHSERRQHFGETDETVALKVAATQRKGLVPIICVGETAADRDEGISDVVLERQVRMALSMRQPTDEADFIIAYEPVWSIGETGLASDPGVANARIRLIGEVVADVTGVEAPCLYGGSVNSRNSAEFVAQSHIDGLFVGRAAWDVGGFIEIVDRCSSVLAPHIGSSM